MSWHLSLPCTRDEGEALIAVEMEGVVLTTSEPDPARPDDWQLDAYFEEEPSRDMLRAVAALVPSAGVTQPQATPLADQDWVTMSQAAIRPLRAGRFYVRTPDYPAVPDAIDFVIPAGLAFGTGQHDTTRGCLEGLDALKRRGKVYRNIIDLGTGTGLLAFAAKRLWGGADVTATDIDPVSIDVVRENAALNGVRGLTLIVADGVANRRLIARAPYDLVIANILAQPLIEMAPGISAIVARGGTLMLAGLLDVQANAVMRAYVKCGMRVMSRGSGEWPVVVMRGP